MFIFYFILAYIVFNFSLLFKEKPENFGRGALLLFFGVWLEAWKNLKEGQNV